MKKRSLRKIVITTLMAVCLLVFGLVVNVSAFSDTVTFAGNSKGFASSGNTIGLLSSTGFKSKLTSFKFSGMPSGTMPNSNTEINFRLYKNENHNVKATVATAHTYSNYVNGTWKSGAFFDGIDHSYLKCFVIASNATSASGLGATVSVQWKYY